MSGDQPRRFRTIEFELDLPRLAFACALVLVLLTGVFLLGRTTAPARGGAGVAAEPVVLGAPGGASAEVEDVGSSAGLFDRVGEQGAVREQGRQVTAESSIAGGWEVGLGTVASRREAEKLRGIAEGLGLGAAMASAPGGGFRVAAGPFATREEADSAARALERALGRGVAVGRTAEP